MKNDEFNKRSLIVVLIIVTVFIFIGLVWLIVNLSPLNLPGKAGASETVTLVAMERNCTYPADYWSDHPEMFPPQIIVGSNVYSGSEISNLLSGSTSDLRGQLQAQLVSAFLNISAGAEQDMIQAAIFQAYEWLVDHPDGSQVAAGELEASSRLFTLLEAYNLGLAGVAACPNIVIPTATPSNVPPSQTATILPSITASQTVTSSPSPTASPTSTEYFPIVTVFIPSQTRLPTTAPTEEPPASTNTQAPPPVPTNTPEPPTQQPPPTFTLPPAATTLPPPP